MDATRYSGPFMIKGQPVRHSGLDLGEPPRLSLHGFHLFEPFFFVFVLFSSFLRQISGDFYANILSLRICSNSLNGSANFQPIMIILDGINVIHDIPYVYLLPDPSQNTCFFCSIDRKAHVLDGFSLFYVWNNSSSCQKVGVLGELRSLWSCYIWLKENTL